MSDQSYWTNELKKTVYFDTDVSYQVKYILWVNPLNSQSLRLTSSGFNYFANKGNVKFYKHVITERLMPKTLLQLEKHCKYPYYIINLKTIATCGEELSLVLTMYQNNIQKYLDDIDNLSN